MESTTIQLPCAQELDLAAESGQRYKIQISWPLSWGNDGLSQPHRVPIIYFVDGNALFLTATEAAWRRASGPHYSGGGLVVAIGYHLEADFHRLYSPRRNFDLTPPSPNRPDGTGGADLLLDFIDSNLRPYLRKTFPNVVPTREALFGHSFGGIFTLHALFTRPTMFDSFIASSPSLWWNNSSVLGEMERFVNNEAMQNIKVPSLMLFYGLLEHRPYQWHDESNEKFQKRCKMIEEWGMVPKLKYLHERLIRADKIEVVTCREYEGEDHGSAMACAASRALTTFFEEWRW